MADPGRRVRASRGRPSWRARFVHLVYATHNDAPAIRRALKRCLSGLAPGRTGLNVGSGDTDLHPSLVNVDLRPGPSVSCCARAESLPFRSDSFALVISQETLEHVPDPWHATAEIHRVLRPGGTFYCQLPFVIGYHPGPTDYWRFTREGIRELLERAGFRCEEVSIAVGGGTALYRIAVEFVAVSLGRMVPPAYHAFKGVAALLLYPIKWLDSVLSGAPQADRIAGGYYAIGRKAG